MYTKKELLELFKGHSNPIRVLIDCINEHENVNIAFCWVHTKTPNLWNDYYEGKRLDEGIEELNYMIDVLNDTPPPDIDDFL